MQNRYSYYLTPNNPKIRRQKMKIESLSPKPLRLILVNEELSLSPDPLFSPYSPYSLILC